jgi:hypothetical protein
MDCHICHEPVTETDGTFTYPCLCPPMHTLCALREAFHEYREAQFIGCPVCRVVYMDHRPTDDNRPIFLETREFKADLKGLKKKRAAANKSRAAFKRVLHQTYLQFREQILMSLDFIEQRKRELLATLKETPEFVEARKAAIGLTLVEGRVRAKYNLGWDECRRYGIGNWSRWGRWSRMPSKMILRKFRLRI